MAFDDLLEARLAQLDVEGLLRSPPEPRRVEDVDLGSNDYLNVGRRLRTGALGSRLLVGNAPEHSTLEAELAAWVGAPTSLTFSSGYAANVGAVSCLAGSGDIIVSDALNHASIVDGCRLARADVHVVPHLDLEAVDRALKGRKPSTAAFVVTEAYFSMDADSPDLRSLSRLCLAYEAALIVDEAHALGVFGHEGSGLCNVASIVPEVLVGTFGKAVGLAGAFIAGSASLRKWAWNRARPFVFSTGMPRTQAARACRHIQLVRAAGQERERLHARTRQFREGLERLGIGPLGHGPIVPWVVGPAHRALTTAARLRELGIHVHAIRPPTVPHDACRIRFAIHAGLDAEDVARALAAVASL